jgi:hypothetical protein
MKPSNPSPPQLPQQPRPMHWPHRSLSRRSMCFWRSDVQDAIEALYDRACCYSPSERRAFVTAVCEGSLMDFPASPPEGQNVSFQPVNG